MFLKVDIAALLAALKHRLLRNVESRDVLDYQKIKSTGTDMDTHNLCLDLQIWSTFSLLPT